MGTTDFKSIRRMLRKAAVFSPDTSREETYHVETHHNHPRLGLPGRRNPVGYLSVLCPQGILRGLQIPVASTVLRLIPF